MPDLVVLRLLIVDDDTALRTALQNAFSELCGWTVVSAGDPVAAQPHYDAVDVVMTDWNMPLGGGARVLSESPKPVLVYSSEIAGLLHPWRLRKPASLEVMRAAIMQAFASSQG